MFDAREEALGSCCCCLALQTATISGAYAQNKALFPHAASIDYPSRHTIGLKTSRIPKRSGITLLDILLSTFWLVTIVVHFIVHHLEPEHDNSTQCKVRPGLDL